MFAGISMFLPGLILADNYNIFRGRLKHKRQQINLKKKLLIALSSVHAAHSYFVLFTIISFLYTEKKSKYASKKIR